MPDLKPVEQMDAEELRREIAERKGATVDSVYWSTTTLDCGESVSHMQTLRKLKPDCPDWPRDLNAAWDELMLDLAVNARPQAWATLPVDLWIQPSLSVEVRFGGDESYRATTLALAICRAWLTWKRGQVAQ
jgi:hypothetical protein